MSSEAVQPLNPDDAELLSTEAAGLLGVIGALLGRRDDIVDVRHEVAPDSHEIVAMKVRTSKGWFRVDVVPIART